MPFLTSTVAAKSRGAEGHENEAIAACFYLQMQPLTGPKGWPLTDREVEGLRLLGAQLRRARLGNGWSQRRLERASGVDQTTISRLENGRLSSLRLVRIAALMQALSGGWELFEGPTRRH